MINIIEVKGLGMRVDKDVYEEVRQETGYSGNRLLKELERVYEGVLEREVDRCADHHLKTVKNAMWRYIESYNLFPKTVVHVPLGTNDSKYAKACIKESVDAFVRFCLDNDRKDVLDYLFYGIKKEEQNEKTI